MTTQLLKLNTLLENGSAIVCSGCGKQPVAKSNFGRLKVVCQLYHSHNPETTDKCHQDMVFPYWHTPSEAINDWNDAQKDITKFPTSP